MGQVQVLNNFSNNLDIVELASVVPELKGTEKKLSELNGYLKPKVFWRELKVEKMDNSRLAFDGGRFVIESAYVASGLKNCRQATLFALTLGEGLPDYAKLCINEGRLWEGSIADLFGSHGIEILAGRFHDYLKGTKIPQGLFSTLRFSPGYGDWQLKEQVQVISYLEAERVIRVTENYLLEPVKSITALVGWAGFPQETDYPQGKRGSGFCGGSGQCAYCTTWACRKNLKT